VSDIPITPQPSAPSASVERSAHREPAPRRAVLVCEDDDGIRELLVEAIEGEGLEVHAARNGREALGFLGNTHHRYVVLLDLMMPDISGYEILERMDADSQLLGEHVVVVISATGFVRPISPGVIQKRLVQGIIKKPFELDELLAIIQQLA
jgi:two-component system response regulator CpxR